jgi:hypothetical protein
VPWLVTLSHHKNWVFSIAGVLIGSNLLYVYRLAPRSCPPNAREACASVSRFSRVVLWISAGIYCVGVFSAYILGRLLMWLGS